MNELLKIEVKDGQQLVSGRDLHNFLEVGTRYNDWIGRIIEKYGFIENRDYIVVTQKRVSNESKGFTEYLDHFLTIPTAKEVSMVSNTEKGRQARQYFIKCEEAWNTPSMILARAMDIQKAMLEENKIKIEQLETKIEEDRPKVLFADAVSTSQTSILIGDLAKLIKQNGTDIGQNRMFEWMRQNGFLISRKGESYNMPTQRAMELGLLEIKERTIVNPDGSIRVSKTTKVTGKGQQYFINIFFKN